MRNQKVFIGVKTHGSTNSEFVIPDTNQSTRNRCWDRIRQIYKTNKPAKMLGREGFRVVDMGEVTLRT